MAGVLYIVATPIGNLADISMRALSVLRDVQLIAAEDTRHSLKLIKQYDIRTPTIALHEHNEIERTQALLSRLKAGENLALVSDAGTPLISDPGYHLVREARGAGIKVVPVPGAAAFVAALSAAGLPSDRFIFEGFLPAKSTARCKALEALKTDLRTLIFYEAPHRIVNLLEDIKLILGTEREICVARELTKSYETLLSGNVESVLTQVTQDPNQQKGEFVVIVGGCRKVKTSMSAEHSLLLQILLEELPLKQAAAIVARYTGLVKAEVYQEGLRLQGKSYY
jgi:16S rRNA (cytidine1402-2'-O)-methyltransferase